MLFSNRMSFISFVILSGDVRIPSVKTLQSPNKYLITYTHVLTPHTIQVYDALDVRLEEVGESFYNPHIPGNIERLTQAGLVQKDEGMLIVRLPHFTIPLIVRKSDGGYGYDSTDMAAVEYRLKQLERDWIIAVTDAGQATHFYMVFDAARAAGWVDKGQRLDHIGKCRRILYCAREMTSFLFIIIQRR